MAGFIVKLDLHTKGTKDTIALGYLSFIDGKLQNKHKKNEAYVYDSIYLAEGAIGNYLSGLEANGLKPGGINMIVPTIEAI